MPNSAAARKTILCLTCWGKSVKSRGTDAKDPYEGWPPIKYYADGSLDLEFGPLLLADGAVMDARHFHDFVIRPPRPLKKAATSLRQLEDKGFLSLVRYDDFYRDETKVISDHTNDELEHVERFRSALRQSIALWEAVSTQYGIAVNRPKDLVLKLPVGILHALAAEGNALSDSRVNALRKIIFKEERLTRLERAALAEIARPYLDHAHTQLRLSKTLDMPVFDWTDIGPIYRKILSPDLQQQPSVQQAIPKTRELFNLVLSELEPTGFDEFWRAITDPRIRNLREMVCEKADKNQSFDPLLAQRLSIEAAQRRKPASHLSHTLSIFASVSSFVADQALGGGLSTSAVVAGVSTALNEVFTPRIAQSLYRDVGWFLCLTEAKSPRRLP